MRIEATAPCCFLHEHDATRKNEMQIFSRARSTFHRNAHVLDDSREGLRIRDDQRAELFGCTGRGNGAALDEFRSRRGTMRTTERKGDLAKMASEMKVPLDV